MIVLVYMSEVSPSLAHDFLTSFPEVFINTGILLSYASNCVTLVMRRILLSGISIHFLQ
jgi:hypothetical protein